MLMFNRFHAIGHWVNQILEINKTSQRATLPNLANYKTFLAQINLPSLFFLLEKIRTKWRFNSDSTKFLGNVSDAFFVYRY